MINLDFEIFITWGNEQKSFLLSDKAILIGTTKNCDLVLSEDDGPKVKAVIQKEENHLLVKIFDTKFPIVLNGKKYKSAKLKNSAFFKLGSLDIILNVEEKSLEDSEVIHDDANEEGFLPDYDDGQQSEQISSGANNDTVESESIAAAQKSEEKIQEIPTLVKEDNRSEDKSTELPQEQPELDVSMSTAQKVETYKSNQTIEDDGFIFDIKFSEEAFKAITYESYSDEKLDFNDYIDLKDETVKELPTRDIVISKPINSVHIVHMNNGTVLNDKYFDLKFKRLYISNVYDKRNCVQVHDCDKRKDEFIYCRDGKLGVVALDGYKVQKVIEHNIEDVDLKTTDLNEGERIVLTKGTSQIIVSISKAPPKIQTNRYFNIDDQLLKSVAICWTFALFMIGVVVVFPPTKKEEVKKEMVVVYKRKKVEKTKKKPTPPYQDVAKAEQERTKPKEKTQKPAPAPPKKEVAKVKKPKEVKKTVVKNRTKVKKPVKKVTVAKASRNKRKVKKVAVKKAPAPAKKKEYKFSFGNKMKSLSSSSKVTQLKAAKGKRKVNSAAAMNSASSMSGSYNSSKFGKTNTKVGRFAAGNPAGSNQALGTRGLSGKTRSTTAYIEANTKILGAIDPELIRKIMREYIPRFRHCYQRELLQNESVAGVFDLEFQINAVGKGVNVGVKSNGKGFSRKGIGCLKRVVSLIKFPKPKGGGLVDVKQPMNFYKQ